MRQDGGCGLSCKVEWSSSDHVTSFVRIDHSQGKLKLRYICVRVYINRIGSRWGPCSPRGSWRWPRARRTLSPAHSPCSRGVASPRGSPESTRRATNRLLHFLSEADKLSEESGKSKRSAYRAYLVLRQPKLKAMVAYLRT